MNIVTYPDPILRKQCVDVINFDGDLKQEIDDMARTMYASRGIGIAAPQVGISKNIVLVDPSCDRQGNQPLTMINPVILWHADQQTINKEGCLSLPNIDLFVPRYVKIDVEYRDIDGLKRLVSASDVLARIMQHEIDHIRGIMMLDRVGRSVRRLTLKKL